MPKRQANTQRRLRISVPATCANLGPGFDVLGLAVQLYNTFETAPADDTVVEIEGDAEGMPRDGTNLFYRSFAHLYEAAGKSARQRLPLLLLQRILGRTCGPRAVPACAMIQRVCGRRRAFIF